MCCGLRGRHLVLDRPSAELGVDLEPRAPSLAAGRGRVQGGGRGWMRQVSGRGLMRSVSSWPMNCFRVQSRIELKVHNQSANSNLPRCPPAWPLGKLSPDRMSIRRRTRWKSKRGLGRHFCRHGNMPCLSRLRACSPAVEGRLERPEARAYSAHQTSPGHGAQMVIQIGFLLQEKNRRRSAAQPLIDTLQCAHGISRPESRRCDRRGLA